MLSTKRFRNAPRQSDFLALVVSRALEGKRTPGHIIAEELFADKFFKDESTHVRATASNLRLSLAKYFDAEGAEDSVRIFLPDPPPDKTVRPAKGEAYTPIFTYNPFQAISLRCKLAEALLPRDLQTSVDHFRAVTALAPGHVGASIGLIEAMCHGIYWAKGFVDKDSIEKLSIEGVTLLDRVVLQEPKSWKAHAVLGFIFTEREQLDVAKQAFSIALSLNRAGTEGYMPYMRYLVLSSNALRALRLAERYFESHLSEVTAYVIYADIFLYAGQRDNAAKLLAYALQMFGNIGLVHHRLFIMAIGERRVDDMVMHCNHMIHSCDPVVLEMTVEYVYKAVESWPEDERNAWWARVGGEPNLQLKTTNVIADVRALSEP